MYVPQKFFNYLIIPALLVSHWGHSVAGFWGAMTGFWAPVIIGTALRVSIGEPRPGTGKTLLRRIGGVVIAVVCAIGFYVGGWQMGWYYGSVWYIATVIPLLALDFIFNKISKRFD